MRSPSWLPTPRPPTRPSLWPRRRPETPLEAAAGIAAAYLASQGRDVVHVDGGYAEIHADLKS